MRLTKEFLEAVDSGNKTRVRIMLKDIMIVDPSLSTFNEMISYAERNMIDLYDEHDGEVFNNDMSTWDENYMNQQMVLSISNFSRERVEHIGRIVKKIFAHKINYYKSSTYNGKKNSSDRSISYDGFSSSQVIGGLVLIAGAGALILSSNTLVTIAGGGAIVGGIIMIVSGEK